MVDTYNPPQTVSNPDSSTGYSTYGEHIRNRHVVDFILYEKPSANGVTRHAVPIASKHDGLLIGDLVDVQCIPVEMSVVADAKKIAGISLCEAGGIGGLTTHGEAYAVYLKPDLRHMVSLKDTYLSSLPIIYAGTVTDERVKTVIKDAVLAQLSTLLFDFVNTAQ